MTIYVQVIKSKNIVAYANSLCGESIVIEDHTGKTLDFTIRNGFGVVENNLIGMGKVVEKEVPASKVWTGNLASIVGV